MINTLNEHEIFTDSQLRARSAEDIPELAAARLAAYLEAEELLGRRVDELFAGDFDDVVMPVDPIGNARRFYGAETDEEAEQALTGLRASSLTALNEAMRKLTYELFPERRFAFDPEAQDFIAYSQHMKQVLADGGLEPGGLEEEQTRRIAEYVENATAAAIAGSDFAEDVVMLTISPCPDDAEEGSGYVPEISKMMLRLSRFERQADGSIVMVNQYLGMRGSDIGTDVLTRAFRGAGALADDQELTPTSALGHQLIFKRAEMDSVLSAAAWLDDAADRALFLGEVIEADQPYDYGLIPFEAAERHASLEQAEQELTAFALELAQQGLDPSAAMVQYRWKVDALVATICEREPELARAAFNDDTADLYAWANQLESMGLYAEAGDVRDEANRERPLVTYCGAGSCDLQRMNLEQALIAAKAGLNADALYFKSGTCGDCGKKGIMIDGAGNSACSCGGVKEKNGPRKPKKVEAKNDKTRPKGRKQ